MGWYGNLAPPHSQPRHKIPWVNGGLTNATLPLVGSRNCNPESRDPEPFCQSRDLGGPWPIPGDSGIGNYNMYGRRWPQTPLSLSAEDLLELIAHACGIARLTSTTG